MHSARSTGRGAEPSPGAGGPRPQRRRREAGGEARALELLAREEVNLVSWRRDLPPGLEGQLLAWARRFPADFCGFVALPRCDLASATRGLEEPARAWLTADVAVLLARLADLSGAGRLRVSLGAIREDQCPRFHMDYVRYRLVTTYVGPGTEWVPDPAVCREALDLHTDCPCDANAEIVRDPSAIRRAAPGEVVVMKGALHPGGLGAVHRSPPIEGTGLVRVVLIASTADRA